MDHNEIKQHILWTISILRTKPLTIHCGNADYFSCRVFIDGYFWGLEYAFNIELTHKITSWFAKKYDTGSGAAPYSLYPEYYHREETDQKKKEILLNLLEEYVNTQM